jgi:hypothetical protein
MAPAEVSEVLCSPWATIEDVPQHILDQLAEDGITPDMLEPYLLTASEMLWMLSGRVWYGAGCEEDVTLRSFPPAPGTEAWPYSGTWGNCRCWSAASYSGGSWQPALYWPGRHVQGPIAVKLPRSPVTAVVSVTIDGDPFTDWNLVRSGWLERTDGNVWRTCDESTLITYQFGAPPPRGGRDAAIVYAAELARDGIGSDSCRLPPNVVNLTRQGVSMELEADSSRPFRVGLASVDQWLDAVNPYSNPSSSQVWSPDTPTVIRTGATREV